jgi:hypothetical protein
MQTINTELSNIELNLIMNALHQTMDSVTGQSNMTNENTNHFVIDLISKLQNSQKSIVDTL